jgi:dTDP-4-amino-4,6-dideoxygalactose transaminase
MTHNGPLVQRLERELCQYLGVDHLVCVCSGTCALQLAIRALELTGEIITTPFSFIATAGIIAWERCRPVFVDIDPDTWNIDA